MDSPALRTPPLVDAPSGRKKKKCAKAAGAATRVPYSCPLRLLRSTSALMVLPSPRPPLPRAPLPS